MAKRKTSRVVFVNITIGLQLGITVFIFVYAGYRLDLYLDKSPLFVAIGTVLGMGIGFYHLMKELNSETKKEESDKDKKTVKWM